VVLARVDLIVALDYPRWRSLARLTRRTLARAIDRRTICNGNTESFRQLVSRDSILVWHFRSFARKRARMHAWAADPDGPAVIRLTSPAATRRWLAALQDTS
jgi:C4-dicarboxylate-specific signal transduction histidine kinase